MTPRDAAAERQERGEPVEGFGTFEWRTGRWLQIFDRQVGVIRGDLAKAQAEDRVIVYLSCPISSRSGGYSGTNVDIANFTARRLMHTLGERVFVLNPAAYQLESREGTGLILEHIRALFGPKDRRTRFDAQAYLEDLRRSYTPGGGDYMRMWVRALVEDDDYLDDHGVDRPKRGLLLGGLLDAFYFLGPSDVATFFAVDRDASLTAAVESYFARKHATDPEFRRAFDFDLRDPERPVLLDLRSGADAQTWEGRRKRFFRYYALRASAAFSLGCRDEWNLLVRLNRKRRDAPAYGAGEELACYFDGRQVSPAAAGGEVARGYEVAIDAAAPSYAGEIAWPKGAGGADGGRPERGGADWSAP